MEILTWQAGIFFGILAAGVLLGRGGIILAAILATVWTVAMIYCYRGGADDGVMLAAPCLTTGGATLLDGYGLGVGTIRKDD